MKTNILSFLFFLYFYNPSWAVLGINFQNSERHHAVCAIEFFERGTQTVSEICSAVVVGKRDLLTAAHCTPSLPVRDHRIFCRGQIEAKINLVVMNSQVDLERLRFIEEERRFDTALIKVDRDLEIPAIRYSVDQRETQDLISKTQVCGVFGHGGFRERLRNAGYSTNARIQPEQIQFDDDLIRIKGYGGFNSGLVEHGDSGGSLSCMNEAGDWVHIAQVSGRTMSAESLFAPVYFLSEDLLEQGVHSIDPKLDNFLEVSKHWRQTDRQMELEKCLKSHLFFVSEEFIKTEDPKLDIKRCEASKLQELKSRLKKTEEVTLKIRPYSLIEVEQKIESLVISHQPSIERLLTTGNPFSTVDHKYMQFKVRSVDDLYAYGDVNIFGYSEYFNCSENILCDGGLYKNIKVKLDDLLYPER